MWKRFARELRCPHCQQQLELIPVAEERVRLSAEHLSHGEQLGIDLELLAQQVEAGLLTCAGCRVWYPILHQLPVLLPYATPLHEEFRASYSSAVNKLGPGYRPPQQSPAPGEAFVLRSFSSEWLGYSYDGVLWTWTYDDRRALFQAEIGADSLPFTSPARFLEIGCGLGLVTSFAFEQLRGDAVGVDLSLAALRAAQHFSSHPFLHFVQASLWNLPFSGQSFDLVYSHGVLHHTFSTRKALESVAGCVRPGGILYAWVYGTGSIGESWSRRTAYAVELAARPLLARLPSPLASAALAPAALAYMLINRLQRLSGSARESYDFRRALHAARDRLTPLYAHRVSSDELVRWFSELGFEQMRVLVPDQVPAAARDTVRRNCGVRGLRRLS